MPCETAHAEDLLAGVGVRVEVDERNGTVHGRDAPNVRLGDGVIAAEHEGDRAGTRDLRDERFDRRV